MKLLITGGHIAPALACVDEFLNHPDIQIIFVGRKYNSLQEKSHSLEYREITKRNIPFINLTAGRLTRSLSVSTLLNIICIPIGLFSAFAILLKEKPHKILSFGGYIALPIAVAAWILRIPIFTHEQTIRPGLANTIISLFAHTIFLSFPESTRFFDKKNIVVTGNPLRRQVFEIVKKPFTISSKKLVIYITGGSLGSHEINEHIKNIIEQLLNFSVVIHQTGNVIQHNDYSKLLARRDELPDKLKENYFLREHIASDEIGFVYTKADLVIGRAGANTFFELIALKKPSILIPLPISAYGEQKKQAKVLKEAGVSQTFDESGKSEELLALIEEMIENREQYQKNFTKLQLLYHANATEIITEYILKDASFDSAHFSPPLRS